MSALYNRAIRWQFTDMLMVIRRLSNRSCSFLLLKARAG
jgi:hypothetical protein